MISFSNIKKTFLKTQFRKLLIEKEENRVVCQEEIKTIGILSTDEITNWIDVKYEVEKIFGIQNAKIYSYKRSSRKDTVSNKHFSEKDFNWKGQVSQPNFKNFIDEPFDLLIGYFSKKNLFLESAVLNSKAKFKAGISKVNQQLYDIEIVEYPTNIEKFLEELKRYLVILKKLKN